MTKSLGIGLTSFSVAYVALSLLAAWWLDGGWLDTLGATYLLVYAGVALCAVFIGLSAGRLTLTGTTLCAFLINVMVAVVVIGIPVALSSRGKGTIVWPPLFGPALVRNWLSLLAGIVASIIWPIVWLLVFRRVAPRLVCRT